MIRSLRLACALGLVVTAGLPACGSSSKGSGGTLSGGTFSTTVDGSKSLGSLSGSDLSTLCSEIQTFSTTASSSEQKSACSFTGLAAASIALSLGSATTDADLQKACSDAVTQCQNTPAMKVDAGAPTCTQPTGTCTATVSELVTCLNDSEALAASVFAKVPSCATLTAKDLSADAGFAGGLGGSTTQPASCAKLDQECPSFTQTSGGGN